MEKGVSYDPFDYFSNEILHSIFKRLSKKELLSSSRVNKEWKKFCKSDLLWKEYHTKELRRMENKYIDSFFLNYFKEKKLRNIPFQFNMHNKVLKKAKIFFFGSTCVGKTTMIQNYLRGTFSFRYFPSCNIIINKTQVEVDENLLKLHLIEVPDMSFETFLSHSKLIPILKNAPKNNQLSSMKKMGIYDTMIEDHQLFFEDNEPLLVQTSFSETISFLHLQNKIKKYFFVFVFSLCSVESFRRAKSLMKTVSNLLPEYLLHFLFIGNKKDSKNIFFQQEERKKFKKFCFKYKAFFVETTSTDANQIGSVVDNIIRYLSLYDTSKETQQQNLCQCCNIF